MDNKNATFNIQLLYVMLLQLMKMGHGTALAIQHKTLALFHAMMVIIRPMMKQNVYRRYLVSHLIGYGQIIISVMVICRFYCNKTEITKQ